MAARTVTHGAASGSAGQGGSRPGAGRSRHDDNGGAGSEVATGLWSQTA
jgi:hypothetical protein